MHSEKRPVNLDLTTMHFPITAIISILHRISGVGIFVLLPFLLHYLQVSLASSLGFAALKNSQFWKIILFLFFAGFLYHCIAGIRHLLMDLGVGETLKGGRCGAKIVLILSVVAVVIVGIILW